MQAEKKVSNFRFIVVGLWLPFIIGIIKVFFTNSSSPFFAKLFMGFIVGMSYIPVFVPVGLLFVGFLMPLIINHVKKITFSRRFLAEFQKNSERNVKKAS